MSTATPSTHAADQEADAASPLLDVHVHRKTFGARDVLKDIDLQVHAGEFVALVGASGCGKSTLLRLIAGLDPAFDGHVRLDGTPLHGPTPDIRFVFQEPRLFPWLTVADNIAFDAGGAKHVAARVASLLDEVGLTGLAERLPKQLSGGQAQRVAIARGLFVQPRVLLLDEPFSAVDPLTRSRLQTLLRRVAQAHRITVLLVTHDVDEAVALADRVLVWRADPGRLHGCVPVRLPHPRRRDDPAVAAAVAQVHDALQTAHEP